MGDCPHSDKKNEYIQKRYKEEVANLEAAEIDKLKVLLVADMEAEPSGKDENASETSESDSEVTLQSKN